MCPPLPPLPARLQEALRLQQLRHAHVVAFYGVALMGSKGLVLMEFCEGAQLGCLYCTSHHIRTSWPCFRRCAHRLPAWLLESSSAPPVCFMSLTPFFGCSAPPPAGRDLHSALEVAAAGSSERLFAWGRRGRRVLYEVAKALNYLHLKVCLWLLA